MNGKWQHNLSSYPELLDHRRLTLYVLGSVDIKLARCTLPRSRGRHRSGWELVVARRDTTKLLDTSKEALNEIAGFVSMLIERARL